MKYTIVYNSFIELVHVAIPKLSFETILNWYKLNTVIYKHKSRFNGVLKKINLKKVMFLSQIVY